MSHNLDKKIIAKKFGDAAKNYDNHAEIQKIAAKNLCKIALPFIKNNALVLDLGAGTSFISKILSNKKTFEQKNLQIFETDLALEMLQNSNCNQANIFKIQSDIENLPFKNHSFDILISSFSLQWLQNFEQSFNHFFSLLKPQGILAFCVPLDESLGELKAANIFSFNQLPKISDLKFFVKKTGFNEIFFSTEIIKQNFTDGLAALKSLKKIGANHLFKPRNIISKTKLKQFENFCLKNCSQTTKKVSASWTLSYFILSK